MTVSGNEYSMSQHFVPEMKGFWARTGCSWWATLPVEARPAATAAPAAGNNLQRFSSPAALALRQKCPVATGHEGKRRAGKWLCINDILKTNRLK